MKKIVFCFVSVVLSVSLLLPMHAFASAHSTGSPVEDIFSSLSSQSYCLMDADTGDVLSEWKADTRLPMASTTKIMTCLVALENADVNAEVTIPEGAVGVEGSSIYLVKGEKLTLHELLYGLMLESANDAAVAIALFVGGSVEAFAELMNQKASEIGMQNSHFCNPNGLQDEDHYSTARDLSVLMSYAMQNPLFAEISSTQTKTITAFDGGKRFLSNHNRLLRSYEYCIAGKTGYTKTAGRCLVTVARRDDKTLVCTTLGDPNDWKDHESLFNYGFSLYTKRSVAEVGSLQIAIPVVGGELEYASVSNTDALGLSLKSGDSLDIYTEAPHFLYAPVTQGDFIGEAVVTLNGKEIDRISLYAQQSIQQKEIKLSFWQKFWKVVQSWFN